jgi:hypothetical protein
MMFKFRVKLEDNQMIKVEAALLGYLSRVRASRMRFLRLPWHINDHTVTMTDPSLSWEYGQQIGDLVYAG